MRRYIFIIITNCTVVMAAAQADTVIKYFFNTIEVNAARIANIKATCIYQDNQWKMDGRYISNNNPAILAYFSDRECQVRNGFCNRYYENGSVESTETFIENKPEGLSKGWDISGRLTDSVFFHHGLLAGKGKQWNANGDIIADYQLDESGNGYLKIYSSAGRPQSEGELKSGKRNNKWIFYNQQGKKNWEIIYQDDNVVAVNCLDAANKNEQSCIFEKEAEFSEGEKGWSKFVSAYLSKAGYPAEPIAKKYKDRLYGQVRVQFVVNTGGFIQDIHIIQSVNEAADALVIAMLRSSPPWKSAIQYGKPVKAYRVQPVTFASQ